MELKNIKHKKMYQMAFIAVSYIDKPDGISVYIENLLQELINEIKINNYNIKIDIYVQEKNIHLLKERIKIPKSMYNINFISISGKYFFIRLTNLIKDLYKNSKCDLIFMPNMMPLVLPFRHGIVTVHDLSSNVAPEYYSLYRKIYFEFLIRIPTKHSNSIAYISKTTKKDLKRFYNITEQNKKLVYLPNGIPFKVQKQKRPTDEEFESKFEKRDLKILFVGRINKHKGFDRILNFVKYVDSLQEKNYFFNSIEFNIVGKKTKETDLILGNYKPRKVKLNFLGYVSDEQLNYLYKTSHFFFFLSRNEGYGLPLIEALWLKTVPVLSDIPIFKEIMGDDFPTFGGKNYEKNIYSFLKKVVEEENYREKIFSRMEKIVEKEKDGYKIAAKNLINVIYNEI